MRTVCCLPAVLFICLALLSGCGGASRKAAAGPPATVSEAAKVLDLTQYPLPKDAEAPGQRCLSELTFNSQGKAKPIFEEQRKYFLDRGWNEEPHTYISDESCSATLTKDGFVVSLSTIPGSGGKTMVQILQHGNVDFASLPVPPGAKSLYAGPVSAIFVCDQNADETKATCHKLLVEKGWQPYGEVGDMRVYKQNAIRLTANITPAPAQGGKMTVTYSAQLMSAELPLPPKADKVIFMDDPAQLKFESTQSVDELASYYRETLAKQGWTATTDKPIHDEKKDELIFRNPQKDLLWLTMQKSDDKLRVELKHQTAAEVEAVERRLRERFEKEKKKETQAEAETK
jgi:hypothetical protein